MNLYRYSIFLVICTFILLVAGGLVTSHEAGLAVPDWPLSYGQLMPPMVGNIAWEHGHRMIAGAVGFLTLILAIWMQFSTITKGIKKIGWIALGAVILQALLGGLTVIFMLPPPVSILHACLGQTFFCILISIAYLLKESIVGAGFPRPNIESGRGNLAPTSRAKRLFLITTILIYIQLILGALIRHTDFTVIPHIVLAFVIVIHVALVLRRATIDFPQSVGVVRTAVFLGIITVTQFFLGLGSFVTTRMIERSYAPSNAEVLFTAAHHSTGALVLGSSFFLTLIVFFKRT